MQKLCKMFVECGFRMTVEKFQYGQQMVFIGVLSKHRLGVLDYSQRSTSTQSYVASIWITPQFVTHVVS